MDSTERRALGISMSIDNLLLRFACYFQKGSQALIRKLCILKKFYVKEQTIVHLKIGALYKGGGGTSELPIFST
jgi:hypothetical protein